MEDYKYYFEHVQIEVTNPPPGYYHGDPLRRKESFEKICGLWLSIWVQTGWLRLNAGPAT